MALEIIGDVIMSLILIIGFFTAAVLYRGLARIDRGLFRLRRAAEAEQNVLSKVGAQLESLAAGVSKMNDIGSSSVNESAKTAAVQTAIVDRMSAALQSLEAHTSGLTRIAKAQVSATLNIEKAMGVFNRGAFGGQSAQPQLSVEEDYEIRKLMSEQGINRQEAEIEFNVRRAEDTFQNFEGR